MSCSGLQDANDCEDCERAAGCFCQEQVHTEFVNPFDPHMMKALRWLPGKSSCVFQVFSIYAK